MIRPSIARVGWLCSLLLCFVALARAGTAQVAKPAAAHTVRIDEPATLTVWNRPILSLRARIDDLGPSLRVTNALGRIEALSDESLAGTVAIAQGNFDELSGVFLLIDTRVVAGILPQDVDPESGLTLQ